MRPMQNHGAPYIATHEGHRFKRCPSLFSHRYARIGLAYDYSAGTG